MLRGGSWLAGASSCAAANRNSYVPPYRNFFSGFRVVLERFHQLCSVSGL
jgi:formylglycine-generating enzyme required for sulfatase activity